MLRNFLKNRKAQNTAEYALLIALVVAAVIAMQTFVQRALQARTHDVSGYMEQQSNVLGNSTQYEPYYEQDSFNVNKADQNTKYMDNADVGMNEMSNQTRNGYEGQSYNSSDLTGQ